MKLPDGFWEKRPIGAVASTEAVAYIVRDCAKVLDISMSELLLMCGEMTAAERRVATILLKNRMQAVLARYGLESQ